MKASAASISSSQLQAINLPLHYMKLTFHRLKLLYALEVPEESRYLILDLSIFFSRLSK